jgi:hypothetical protein
VLEHVPNLVKALQHLRILRSTDFFLGEQGVRCAYGSRRAERLSTRVLCRVSDTLVSVRHNRIHYPWQDEAARNALINPDAVAPEPISIEDAPAGIVGERAAPN